MQKLREDERLVAIRHRAGYAAFQTVFIIAYVLMIVGMFINDIRLVFFPLVLVFPATLVFVIQLRRGGYYSSMNEEIHRHPNARRRQYWSLVFGGAMGSALWFLSWRYLPILSGGERSMNEDLLFSLGFGISWTTIMLYLNHRRNASKAGDEGDGEDQ